MTSALETDPNIKLSYSPYTTAVQYEDGNIGYNPHNQACCSLLFVPVPACQFVKFEMCSSAMQQ